MRLFLPISFFLALIPGQRAIAGEADILKATVHCDPSRICHFSVSVRHQDQGWQHYADRWEILDSLGNHIATRTLAHPHDHEQPFTRSLGGVFIPHAIHSVTLQAHDSVHAYGGKQQVIALPN